MTHFFLHGGIASADSETNEIFFQNICNDGDKILICLFGKERDKEQKFIATKDRFLYYNSKKKLSFESASEDIHSLLKQIKSSSLIYLVSGDNQKYLNIFSKIPDIKNILTDKTIVGVSAGSLIWSKIFYSQNEERVKTGLGLLPIKCIVHWGSKYSSLSTDEERLKLLEEYGEKLPIIKIPEQEYKEFTI
ncbi:MAG: Type 1 glutamine amidotransferase-like domain-containing protein [candidate division SR1 bacterium]|nr:Type 1 glutamine amidotransferase-like domain-containing protein [candidate division SR1 bacterium]